MTVADDERLRTLEIELHSLCDDFRGYTRRVDTMHRRMFQVGIPLVGILLSVTASFIVFTVGIATEVETIQASRFSAQDGHALEMGFEHRLNDLEKHILTVDQKVDLLLERTGR